MVLKYGTVILVRPIGLEDKEALVNSSPPGFEKSPG
jgi:hypothetical protein